MKYDMSDEFIINDRIGYVINRFHREYENAIVNLYLIVFHNGITEPYTEEELDFYGKINRD